jgi:hypothetical protein
MSRVQIPSPAPNKFNRLLESDLQNYSFDDRFDDQFGHSEAKSWRCAMKALSLIFFIALFFTSLVFAEETADQEKLITKRKAFIDVHSEYQTEESRQWIMSGAGDDLIDETPQSPQKFDPEEFSKGEESELEKLKKQEKEERNIRHKAFFKKHPSTRPEIRNLIKSSKITIGMTSGEVEASWGAPNKINRTVSTLGVHEQWIYGEAQYLYFDNGVMTSFQDSR